MSESDQEQSSSEPLSPRAAAVRAGLRRNYSSSSAESKSYESEGSSNMAEIPNNNNDEGGAALIVQPRKPLREFSIPKVTDQPSCIVYPQLTVDRFELKSGMIHLLPTYYGNTTEDPYMHIKQFFEICATLKIQGLDDEQIKMRLFPFSLKDKAKSWLYSLPNASIHTWEELSNKFLQKFFPAQKTNKIRKEILGFTQREGEAFHECWERYKEMISSCPHHNIESWMQMQSFYEGLLDSERMMVDATSGEGLMNKTADEAFTLFESLSANSQQWSHNKGRGAPMKAVVSEVSTNNEIAAKLDVMCSLLQQAVTGPLGNKVEVQDQSFAEHMLEQANALQARNPQNDPYSNTYNPGWRNHPNFRWNNNPNVQQSQGPPPGFQTQQRQFQQAPQQVQEQRGDQMGELQDMFKKFMGQQMQTNQNLQNAVNKLEVQVGQIASSMSNRASGTFPSQTEVNPRHQEHAKAVHILRSGKQVDNKVGDANEEQEDGENVEIIQSPHGQPTASNKQSINAPGKSTGPKEQSSSEPLSPRAAAVRAGLRRNYSSSSAESKSYESEGSSNMAEIPNNNNDEGGAALIVQPRKPLREFSIPKVTDQPSCIVYPQLTVDRFELKSGMIHLLPTYYGNTTEDPYMHIKQFFEICATLKIQGLDDEQIKMRLFPFSLKDKAKSWLYSLPNASIHTWEELSNKFLQKFFPAQKTNKIRKEILGFTQREGEAFHECWERYKEMISSCPHHNIESWMQMQSFYEGLLDSERMMVDATSGEGLMNKTADEAFTLFESLSANSQQWSHNKGRGAPMKAVVSEVSTNNEIAAKLDVMCSLLQQAVTGPLGNKVEVQDQSFAEHMLEQANALQARNPQNDPYSNTYNPGWRNHPNFRWNNNPNVQQSQGPPPGFQTQQRQFQQAPQQVQEQRGDQMGELQDMFKKFMGQQMQTNQNLQNAVNKLEVQVGQIASSMSNRASGTFPSQTEVNPRHQEHAKAVHILRSGKQVDNKVGDANEEQEDGENVEIIQPPHGQPTASNKQSINAPGKSTGPKVSSNAKQVPISTNACRPIAPFPSRLSKSKKDQGLDEIMETFKKVQINIPLLNAITQIPKYANFLKDLCTNKRRFKEHEQVALSEEVSAVLQRKLPPKLKDPGSFSIPCIVGDFKFQKALLDLGASINLMPYHVYEKLNLGELQATSVSIQLADRTIRYPKGILEDVLVKVEELILPADFLVLEMEEAPIHDNQLPLILGRPFMATAGAIIDVKKGTLTMNVFDETIAFKVFEASKFPSDEHEVFHLDAIDTMVKEALPMSYLEPIEACITQSKRKEEVDSLEAVISPLLLELACSMDGYIEIGKRYANQFESLPPPTNKVLPSIVQAPELELKQLPKHLKYAYLGENETLPVIIASHLGPNDENKLLRVLKEHKTAIGWSIADIKGISPTLCMHKILLEDNAMPKRDAQRRLNPNMKEVVRKEVIKLLNVGIIYPISDSKWVSPVQVVPKKSGITVVKNEANELVPTRMTTGWRVCIDYRKLNTATSKDHFPLPFIDQMLERLAGHSHYCFLDGYSGYNQIAIAPEDQEKTTFTCPFGTFAYRRMPFGLCNAPATFQRCMMRIFSDLARHYAIS
ncbi:hypothetical protein L3X38_017889 [Prunus dulcis]|uniref:Transposable element protein n=1 Tax=Prunus dulcis TaxID=3755 RepID=A0AAD4ZB48_PRUDU|nr:hypothetical protein L3X38_017889 [Prunus dulcis]